MCFQTTAYRGWHSIKRILGLPDVRFLKYSLIRSIFTLTIISLKYKTFSLTTSYILLNISSSTESLSLTSLRAECKVSKYSRSIFSIISRIVIRIIYLKQRSNFLKILLHGLCIKVK